jgi:hypothetical protein
VAFDMPMESKTILPLSESGVPEAFLGKIFVANDKPAVRWADGARLLP